MITFKQHIDLMNHLSSGGSVDTFLSKLKDIDKIRFLSFFEEVYPIEENMIHSKKLESDRNIYKDVESLVLGQFIMLEQIITGKTQLPDHLVDLEILKLIIRPKTDKVFDNEDPEKEKENQSYILNSDVRSVYHILNTYINKRNKTLFEDFSGVFYEPNNGDEVDEENDNSNTSEMAFNQQWYWYSIVRMLSKEDIHRYQDTYMLPMNVVLPEMSYLAQKNKIESAQQRQAQAMRKL